MQKSGTQQATKHVTDVLKPHFQVFVIYIPEQICRDMKSLFQYDEKQNAVNGDVVSNASVLH